jgi:hypothetical protein
MRGVLVRLVLALVCTLAGCGGGGPSTSVPPPPPTPTPGPNVPVAFAIVIPAKFGSSQAHAPRYVSPATQVVQISVNGGAPQTFQVSGGQPCTNPPSMPGNGTCTVFGIQAPLGNDTFVVTLLDGANHVLSSGTTQQTILQDVTNTVAVTFNGVAVGLRIALSNAAPPTGVYTRIAVSLTPLDAAGYSIIGAPGSLPAITVTDSDTTGTTSLFLAGSDMTCGTQGAAASTSVTTTMTTSGGSTFYTNVCLAYGGQALPGGAQLTATASGGLSASATFHPTAMTGTAAAGAWVYGTETPSFRTALERFDAHLVPVAKLTASGSQLDGAGGLAVDAAGNAYLFMAFSSAAINEYASTASGNNVAPMATTTVQLPPAPGGYSGLALDGAGNAFTVSQDPNSSACTVFRIALTNGPSTLVNAADCSIGRGLPSIASDGRFVYVGVTNLPGTVALIRYTLKTGGTLTRDSILFQIPYLLGLDPSGNILAGSTPAPYSLALYSSGAFVSGQQSISPGPFDTFPGVGTGRPASFDASGNLFVTIISQTGSPNVGLVPAGPPGSHAISATSNFVPTYIQGLIGQSTSGGSSIVVSPQSIETQSSSTFSATENGYTGTFSEIDDCGSIATVVPASASGPMATFKVQSKVLNGGTCHVTITDGQNSGSVLVGVTVTNITGSSHRRKP